MQLAAGQPLEPLGPYRAGTMFVRISLDQYTSMETFAGLAQQGELVRASVEGAPR